MKSIYKRLDTIFSILIRLKYTDDNGKGNCYTCGNPLTYHTGQCGHYIKRGNVFTRWDSNNARIQCEECNCIKDGFVSAFRDRLVSELGYKEVAQMEFESKKPYKMFEFDKESLFKQLKAECKELLKDKMFNVSLP